MKQLFWFVVLFPVLAFSQNELSVEVHGVPSSEGKINVAVYNSEDGFLKFDKVFKCDSIAAQKGVTHLSIKNLPAGEYALAIFYDENGNNKLDTNWLGIPKEKVAFSNAKMKTFGPPNFKECSFKVVRDVALEVFL
ncbi:MAG: hypothetical protein CMH48_01530 [Muricauda sp.]|nr:DUF2141 domain-containing protein [Allomuricauda sp.]MBC29503.1 hypothetical protein [Allomuricauda sp.]|tara:strand:- start:50404 stop:50811 length:408 start_codon:yes stop_codon:yes gene_type:complete